MVESFTEGRKGREGSAEKCVLVAGPLAIHVRCWGFLAINYSMTATFMLTLDSRRGAGGDEESTRVCACEGSSPVRKNGPSRDTSSKSSSSCLQGVLQCSSNVNGCTV